ncbi:hypothetical protein BH11MYX1_BH11MYX1_55380 [soil metagenome]
MTLSGAAAQFSTTRRSTGSKYCASGLWLLTAAARMIWFLSSTAICALKACMTAPSRIMVRLSGSVKLRWALGLGVPPGFVGGAFRGRSSAGAGGVGGITVSEVAQFRAALVAKKLSEKRINNILAVLSKPLKYAVDCELIAKSPKIGLFKVERPEIVAWDFAQYACLLVAANAEGEVWYTGVCLAGEAGLRVGEVKALRWREDVDMIAATITVNQQTRNSETTTPKGRTRRMVPMTSTLLEALKRMETIREGFVVRNLDGTAKTEGEADAAIKRICRRAGLPVLAWHTLRHTFGTHAALFGVNPWRLRAWMGHKRIDETMLYVHVAEAHGRELPDCVRDAGLGEADPDARVRKMLGARGKNLAKTKVTDQDRGPKYHSGSPPTPPGMRVRTRRFESQVDR